MLGLVLTAGGARGAYQAGVMKRLGEIPSLRRGAAPFQIITGASAGAINGTMLAATGRRFGQSTRALAALWGELTVDRVLVGGAWTRPTGPEIRVLSPSTEEPALRVVDAGPEDIDRAVAAARKAFEQSPWRAMTPRQRADVLLPEGAGAVRQSLV